MSRTATASTVGYRLTLSSLNGKASVWTPPSGPSKLRVNRVGRETTTIEIGSHAEAVAAALQYLASIRRKTPEEAYCATYDGKWDTTLDEEGNRRRYHVPPGRPWSLDPAADAEGRLERKGGR